MRVHTYEIEYHSKLKSDISHSSYIAYKINHTKPAMYIKTITIKNTQKSNNFIINSFIRIDHYNYESNHTLKSITLD